MTSSVKPYNFEKGCFITAALPNIREQTDFYCSTWSVRSSDGSITTYNVTIYNGSISDDPTKGRTTFIQADDPTVTKDRPLTLIKDPNYSINPKDSEDIGFYLAVDTKGKVDEIFRNHIEAYLEKITTKKQAPVEAVKTSAEALLDKSKPAIPPKPVIAPKPKPEVPPKPGHAEAAKPSVEDPLAKPKPATEESKTITGTPSVTAEAPLAAPETRISPKPVLEEENKVTPTPSAPVTSPADAAKKSVSTENLEADAPLAAPKTTTTQRKCNTSLVATVIITISSIAAFYLTQKQ